MTQALDNSRFLAGNPKGKGPEGSEVPNITPDMDTGIGKWTEEQIATYIATGNLPNGDVAGGLMGEVIQGSSVGYKDMTKADLARHRPLPQVDPRDQEQDRGLTPSPNRTTAGSSGRRPAKESQMRRSSRGAGLVVLGLAVVVAAGCASDKKHERRAARGTSWPTASG